MKEMWSRDLLEMKPYVCGEQPKDKRYIKLNTNENPYPPSPEAIKSISEAAKDLRLYPDPQCSELTQAISEFTGVDKRRIFAGNGSDEVLALAFRAFFSDGPLIKTPDIGYSFYPVYAEIFKGHLDLVPLNEDMTLPVEKLFDSDGGVLLANPNAPTGEAISRRDIERILQRNDGRLVIIDEAYVDFGGESAIPLLDKYSNLLIIRTTSKAHSLAGLRAGWAMGNENLIAALETVKNCINSYTVDRIAQACAAAAIRDKKYWSGCCSKIISTRNSFVMKMQKLGFVLTDSKANFVFVRHPGHDANELFVKLREKGILVRWFDQPRVRNYLRISIGTPEDMEILIKTLADITAV